MGCLLRRGTLLIKNGDIFYTKQGYKVEVVDYVDYRHIKIKFLDEHKAEVWTQGGSLKKGSINNPYKRTLYGVGYLGQGRFLSKKNGVQTAEYAIWKHMIMRVYSPKSLISNSSYENCSVCEDWHNFQKFAEWYTNQKFYNKGYHLDKDILVKGNRVYSPENCCLVPQELNMLFTDRKSKRGKYPIGVISQTKGKTFAARVMVDGNKIWLGTFKTKEDAFEVYKMAKEENVKRLAELYKCRIDFKTYSAMKNFTVENDIENRLKAGGKKA